MQRILSVFEKIYFSVQFDRFLLSLSPIEKDSHLDLTAGDGEGGAGGEASNHWLRDEVDQEAKP